MAITFKISDAALAILRSSTVDANSLTLPPGQLDRKLYMEVNEAITAIGGKWNRKAGKHLFDNDPREEFGDILGTGTVVNKKQVFQSFYTPREVIQRMAQEANIRDCSALILEPNCGDGRIMDYLVEGGHLRGAFDAYDIDPNAVKTVRVKGYLVEEKDFLTVTPVEKYDYILMNPPFTKNQDISHVLHAFRFLKRGGRLVSITSPSWTFGTQKKQVAFRDFLEELGAKIIELDSGAFKESGTTIETRMIVIDKPM